MIAAGTQVESRRLSLFEMKQIISVLHDKQAAKDFEALMPEILDMAMKKSDIDAGRVTEYADETSLEVGENYVLDIKSVTLSCVVSEASSLYLGGTAYASHVLAYSPKKGIIFDSVDPRAYSRSVLLEADVMELPVESFMFVPKRYCLDLQDVANAGVAGGGDNSVANKGRAENVRSFTAGTTTRQVRATANQVGWINTGRYAEESESVERAFKQPKAELNAFIDIWEAGDNSELCLDVPQGTREYVDCLAELVSTYLMNDTGFAGTPNLVAAQTAILSYFNMRYEFRQWNETKFGGLEATDNSDAAEVLPFDLQDIQDYSFDLVPLLFDQSIASTLKNSPIKPGLQVNP